LCGNNSYDKLSFILDALNIVKLKARNLYLKIYLKNTYIWATVGCRTLKKIVQQPGCYYSSAYPVKRFVVGFVR